MLVPLLKLIYKCIYKTMWKKSVFEQSPFFLENNKEIHYVYNSTFLYNEQIEELQALVKEKNQNSEIDSSKNVGRRFSPGIISCNIKEQDALSYTKL